MMASGGLGRGCEEVTASRYRASFGAIRSSAGLLYNDMNILRTTELCT